MWAARERTGSERLRKRNENTPMHHRGTPRPRELHSGVQGPPDGRPLPCRLRHHASDQVAELCVLPQQPSEACVLQWAFLGGLLMAWPKPMGWPQGTLWPQSVGWAAPLGSQLSVGWPPPMRWPQPMRFPPSIDPIVQPMPMWCPQHLGGGGGRNPWSGHNSWGAVVATHAMPPPMRWPRNSCGGRHPWVGRIPWGGCSPVGARNT